MTSHLPFYALFNETRSLYSLSLNLYPFKMFHTHTLENKIVQIKRRIEVLIMNVNIKYFLAPAQFSYLAALCSVATMLLSACIIAKTVFVLFRVVLVTWIKIEISQS